MWMLSHEVPPKVDMCSNVNRVMGEPEERKGAMLVVGGREWCLATHMVHWTQGR